MLQAPIFVVQHHWADQPRQSRDAAMREIFLSNANHSLGRYWRECTFGMIDPQTGGEIIPIKPLGLAHDTYYDQRTRHRGRSRVQKTRRGDAEQDPEARLLFDLADLRFMEAAAYA